VETSARVLVSVTAWICVTLIILVIMWITQLKVDFLGLLIVILILLGIPFVLTFALLGKE
jgi:Na+/citrate or Na+/malate symporter